MRPSLTEIQEIEAYLETRQPAEDRLLFQARALAAPELAAKISCQQKIVQLVRWLARKEQHKKLDALFHQLMKEDQFRQSLITIFR